MTGFVYAIVADSGLVKIGYSKKPELRFNAIRTASSGPCRLVGYVPGTRKQECELHRLLVRSRSNGEWYLPDRAVKAFVDMLPPAPPRPLRLVATNARPENSDLLALIDEFQGETGLSDFRVGFLIAKNGRLLPNLRDGKRVWPETEARIREYIAERRRSSVTRQ